MERVIWFILCTCVATAHVGADPGTLVIRVHSDDGHALPCRIHLWDAEQKPVPVDDYPFWYDHLVCDGRATLNLTPGEYTYLVDRGPEYRRQAGRVLVSANQQRRIRHELTRITHLREQGWWSGDLHIHRPLDDVPLLMRAGDLDVGPVISWWNKRNLLTDRGLPTDVWEQFDGHRYLSLTAGEDERQGGALLYFGMAAPIDITQASAETPSPLQFVAQSRDVSLNVWIDIEKPFWQDVPIWLASGQMQSIGLANNHMCRDQMLVNEAWGFARDTARLPNPLGNGYWTQEIYYHMLNCGIRIPPSAGSASGVLRNPVGYNRVYVHVTGPWSIDAWWNGLRRGHCFVTNGPLLVCRASGQLPGSTLRLDTATDSIELDIQLSGRDPIRHLEVIHNGKQIKSIPVARAEHQTIQTTIQAERSGWFLVRGIADNERTFRFASTGPFYVQVGHQPAIISRASAQFFADWLSARSQTVHQALTGDASLESVLEHHRRAREFWRQKLASANTD